MNKFKLTGISAFKIGVIDGELDAGEIERLAVHGAQYLDEGSHPDDVFTLKSRGENHRLYEVELAVKVREITND